MSALLLLYYQIFHYLNVRLAIAKDFLYDFYSLNQFRLACYPFFIVESLTEEQHGYVLRSDWLFSMYLHTLYTADDDDNNDK